MHHPTDRIIHTTAFIKPVVEHWLERVMNGERQRERERESIYIYVCVCVCVWIRGKNVRSWCDGSSGRSFMVDPLGYFSFHPVLHDRCNKVHGMCYPVCGMVHIKDPLLLIEKCSLCGASGFLSRYLSGPLPYVRCHITVNEMCWRKEMFYLTTHSTHFIYGYKA